MNKGFTLIELLAVIVILAIIALIATPIVLSIINDTKESAVIRSGEFYVDAVQSKIMQENMKLGGTLNPNECIIDSNGNATCDGTFLEIEVDGEKPTGGSITFDKGKVANINLTFGERKVVTNANGELVLENNAQVCKLIDGEPNEIGSKYECEVKAGTKFNFYVLSHESNGTTNLIMERNICEDGTEATAENTCSIAWQTEDEFSGESENSSGPILAMSYLHNATKNWNNISNIIMDYEDENIHDTTLQKGTTGYGGIKTIGNQTVITNKSGQETLKLENLKARMPKYSEVANAGCTKNSGSCPLWLVNYLNSSSYITGSEVKNINGISGYWTLASQYGTHSWAEYNNYAWYIRYEGYMGAELWNEDADGSTWWAIHHGVRPVINVKL